MTIPPAAAACPACRKACTRIPGGPVTPILAVTLLPPGIQPGENRELVAYVENQTDEARFTGTGENFVYSGFRLRPRLAIFESL